MKPKYLLPLLLLLQILLLKIVSFFPELVERWYSDGVYVYISKTLRIVLGKIPFSVGDCLYFVLIIYCIHWFWGQRKKWLQHRLLRIEMQSRLKNIALSIFSYCSIIYFLFHLFWGMNYYRVPLHKKMNIKQEYTDADLLQFTQQLIAKTNAIQLQLMNNKNKKVVVPYTKEQLFEMNSNGYKNLALEHPFFTYSHLSIKKSLFSIPLTYMGFGGYLNPFTNEAQANSLGPLYSFSMTANHEMAHQIGFASESECNFIGFLASIENENLYIQYSGYSIALRYCLRNWQMKDEVKLNSLLATIHPGVLENFNESEQFWKQYDTFIDKGFHFLYDKFLKINQQDDGIESYSNYVNLMINYFKNES